MNSLQAVVFIVVSASLTLVAMVFFPTVIAGSTINTVQFHNPGFNLINSLL